jgi:predicted membrane channel-forming protein YqfA (hemolysin III family)
LIIILFIIYLVASFSGGMFYAFGKAFYEYKIKKRYEDVDK